MLSKKKLNENIKDRFQRIDPLYFEEVVADLFESKGFKVKLTSRSKDFGADFIAWKNGEKIACQVKRYHKNNKVGVKDLNQVLGAKDYYNCNKAMLITTSSLTYNAWELANNVDNLWVWEWEELNENFKKCYFNNPKKRKKRKIKKILKEITSSLWHLLCFVVLAITEFMLERNKR